VHLDDPLTEVYVDLDQEHMFVKVTGSGFGGPGTIGPSWHGPFCIDLIKKAEESDS
jgi:hypothetical protein